MVWRALTCPEYLKGMQNALKVFINNLGVVICPRSKAQLYKVGADEQIIMLVDEVQGSTTIKEVSSSIYIHFFNDVWFSRAAPFHCIWRGFAPITLFANSA